MPRWHPQTKSRLRRHNTQDRPHADRLLLPRELQRGRLRERRANRNQALVVVEGVAHHLILVDVEEVVEFDDIEEGDVAAWSGDERDFVDIDV